MIILVTGITGFIGSRTAIELLNKGYKVRGTMRDLKRADEIKAVLAKHAQVEHNLEFVQTELTSYDGWEKAMEGVEYVQHIASPVPVVQPENDNDIIAPAREGTLNVLKAAKKMGVKRVIQTSSVAAIGYGHHADNNNNSIFTEQSWTNLDDTTNTNPYIRSKTISEQAAWDFIKNEKEKKNNVDDTTLELVCILPGFVLGPVLEQDYGPSATLVKKLMNGDLPGIPQLGFCFVDVRDVADLHIQAMIDPKAAGQRLICTNEWMWMSDVVDVLRAGGYHPNKLPKILLPNWMMRLVSLFDQETRGVMIDLGVRREYTSQLAQTTLGWKPRPAADAIRATADSLIALKLV